MPKRSRQSRIPFKKRKRRFGGYARSKRKLTIRRNRMRPVNQCRLVKMRYCDTISINPGVGTVAKHMFRCSSIFDPDYTGVGHQPMGHDEITSLYNYYTVVGSKITAQFTASTSGPVGAQTHVGVLMDDDGTTPTSTNDIREQANSSFRLLRGLWGGKGAKIVTKFSPKKFYCIKNRDLPPEHTALVGQNPSKSTFFSVWASGIDTAEDPDPVHVDVTIEYLVKFTDPKTLASS